MEVKGANGAATAENEMGSSNWSNLKQTDLCCQVPFGV